MVIATVAIAPDILNSSTFLLIIDHVILSNYNNDGDDTGQYR